MHESLEAVKKGSLLLTFLLKCKVLINILKTVESDFQNAAGAQTP